MPGGDDTRATADATAGERTRGGRTRRAMLRTLGGAGIAGLSATTGARGAGSPGAASAGQATRDGWTQAAKLAAADGDPGDSFGFSVAVDGSTAVVGARGDEDPNGERAGSAYVFEKDGYSWIQAEKLVAADGDGEDGFGFSVAVDGSTAVVGASRDDDPNGPSAGSAYVFERDAYSWTQAAKLVAADGDGQDRFGSVVAVEGSTAVVGAPAGEAPGGAGGDPEGSAYVFERGGGSWAQAAKLVAADGDPGDSFGGSVAVEGSTAVVGAGDDREPNGERAGSAYVFERRDGEWIQAEKLAAADGDSEDGFGASVAVEGSTAVVGAPDDEGPDNSSLGSVYVFERRDGVWTQTQKLTPEESNGVDEFGFSVTVDGSRVVISAFGDGIPIGNLAGAAYVFERRDGSWVQTGMLTPADGDGEDAFGFSVETSGSTTLVGAFGDEDPNGTSAGSTYVFEAPATTGEGATPTRTSTAATPTDERTDGENAEGSGAGLGVGSAVAGIAGVGYLLKRRASRRADR